MNRQRSWLMNITAGRASLELRLVSDVACTRGGAEVSKVNNHDPRQLLILGFYELLLTRTLKHSFPNVSRTRPA